MGGPGPERPSGGGFGLPAFRKVAGRVLVIGAYAGVWMAVFAAAGLALGRGPLASLRDGSGSGEGLRLEKRSFEAGDCVVWDQQGGARVSAERQAEVVDCDRPHLIEITGLHRVDAPDGAPFPSEADWAELVGSGECLELAERHLGGPMDPEGRLHGSGITPSAESWDEGHRDVWCGLARDPDDQASLALAGDIPFRGRVGLADQHRVFPVGSCLGIEGTSLTSGTVPCDGPHAVEISGHVDLTGATAYPGPGGFAPLVSAGCSEAAARYLGRAPAPPARAGWIPIGPGSWDSGRRVVVCTVAEYDGDAIRMVGRPLAGDS